MISTSPTRVSKIKVSGLFGLYTHTVALDQRDRVTIIHGPNGVGKTVLLRLIYALFTGRLDECLRTPMTELEVTLSDGSLCGIRPLVSSKNLRSVDEKNTRLEGTVFLKIGDNIQEGPIAFNPQELLAWATRFADESPYLLRVDHGRWVDRRDESLVSATELMAQYQDRIPEELRMRIFAEPPWFSEFRKRVSVHIIETQRLLRFGRSEAPIPATRLRDNREFVSTVRDYAKDLTRRIRDALTRYARDSQRLDQTFPQRLLAGNPPAISVDALKSRMESLEQRRERLTKIGLLDSAYSYPFNLDTLDNVDPTKQDAITLYVGDTEKKLGVFDDLARRIEALLANVNDKFRNTCVKVSRDEGLVAETKFGEKLDLDALSFGEQHELVLLYDLLFKVRPNTLILIDEPELSLHISWQKRFLSDLLAIVRISDCDVLLATHSIFVAGDRPDLMVALTKEDSGD
jgi:ABC-type lipoprotein export system ATPase subunit